MMIAYILIAWIAFNAMILLGLYLKPLPARRRDGNISDIIIFPEVKRA